MNIDKEEVGFEDTINQDWKYDTCYEREDPQVVTEQGILVEILKIWGRHKPAIFDFSEKEAKQMTMLMLNANKLYKIVEGLDSKEAKDLIKLINTGDPENFRVKQEE